MNIVAYWQWMGMPPDHSEHGSGIDSLIFWMHVLMAVLFVGWGLFFLYTLVRFRRGANPKADPVGVRSHGSSYIEAAVAVIEFVLLFALSIPLWADRVENFPPDDKALTIRVVAQQFQWNIHYPGPDGKFGNTDARYVDDASGNFVGLDPSDPASADDVLAPNQLYLPVNKPVVIQLSSRDVIHSFFIPILRCKLDAVPGNNGKLWFTPVKEGQGFIQCAQLCGVQHAVMKGFCHIVSEGKYSAWLAGANQETRAMLGLPVNK